MEGAVEASVSAGVPVLGWSGTSGREMMPFENDRLVRGRVAFRAISWPEFLVWVSVSYLMLFMEDWWWWRSGGGGGGSE